MRGMNTNASRIKAKSPEQLAELLLARMNAGDVDGVVALYSNDALLVLPNGQLAEGASQIRAFYQDLLSTRPQFVPGVQSPPLISGNIALTSSTLTTGKITAEIACRKADGTWVWVVDHPAIGDAPR